MRRSGRWCRGRPSRLARLLDQPLDVPFISDALLPRSCRAKELEIFEGARLAVRPINAQHLSKELALVATLLPSDTLEVPRRFGRDGNGENPRWSLHVLQIITIS